MTDASSLQDDYNKVNDYIESVRRRFPSYQTINLVGHSMGGLVARKWATDHPGEVNVVITLGTPNLGIYAIDAIPELPGGPGFLSDLKTANMATHNKGDLKPVNGVTYIALAGIQGRKCLDGTPIPWYEHTYDNDGCVDMYSALGIESYVAYKGKGSPDLKIQSTYTYLLAHADLIKPGEPTGTDVFCDLYYPDGVDHVVCESAWVASSSLKSPSQRSEAAAGAATESDQDSADADLIVDQVVPAGGSVDVPVTFEASSFGSVQVVSSAGGVAATFGGTALSGVTTGYTSITTSVSNPTDGPVHVVNQGTTAATVTVIANVDTTRHLEVTPASSTVGKGGTVNFDAIVSEATTSDGASAYLQDPSGAKTPVVLTKVGTGHWTAQVSPTLSGTYEVHVQTTGTRVRYGTALISVSTGNVSIGSGFTEQLLDTDGDGLANQLKLTASVTALNPGSYLMTADLVDAHGTEVSSGSSGALSLVSGAQPVSIAFDGASIYKSGLSGPYHFVNITLTNESDGLQQAAEADLGATQAYDYHTFQHFPVLIDRAAPAITAVDADGNGFYESLNLAANVTVDTSGSYVVGAGLFAADGTEVGEVIQPAYLAVGANAISLQFDGSTIWKSGKGGPYTVQDLSVYLAADSTVKDTVGSAVATPAYTASQFTPPPSSAMQYHDVNGYRAWYGKLIDIGYSATFPSGGQGSVDLYLRYSADGYTFGNWSKVATQEPIGIDSAGNVGSAFWNYRMSLGAGRYEFKTVAIDGVTGEREALPQDTPSRLSDPVDRVQLSSQLLPQAVGDTDAQQRDPKGGITNQRAVSVAVFTSYPSDSGSFELWEAYTPPDQWESGDYSLVTTSSTSPVSVTLSGPDGEYTFRAVPIDADGTRGYGATVKTVFLDTSTPTSSIDALPPVTTAGPLPVKVSMGPADGGMFQLWSRYRATTTDMWGDWELSASTTYSWQPYSGGSAESAHTFQFGFPHGAGIYEFESVGSDVAGNVEPRGSLATASTTYAPTLNSAVGQISSATLTNPTVSIPYVAGYPSGSGSVELHQAFKAAGASSFSDYSTVLTTSANPIPYTLSLGDGTYEFYTVAIDSTGSEAAPTSADVSVLLDTTAPVVTLGALPAVETSGPITISCSAEDAESGVGVINVLYRYSATGIRNQGFTPFTEIGICDSNGQVSFDFPQGEGYYDFSGTAYDTVGNTQSPEMSAWTSTHYDPAPQSHMVAMNWATSYTQQWVYVDSNMPYELWGRWKPAGTSDFGDWYKVQDGGETWTNPVYLSAGTWEFYSIAVSVDGEREQKPQAAETWLIVDMTPPSSTVGTVPTRTSQATVTVPVTASDDLSGVKWVNVLSRYKQTQDASWSDWNAVAQIQSSSGSVSVSLDQGQGFYQFASQARDLADNIEATPTPSPTITHYTTGGDPSSTVLALPGFTNTNSVTVPYIADFASGTGSIDLYERFEAKGASTFTIPANVASTTSPNPLTAPLTQGDGRYEFYTVATDAQSHATEAAPANADAFTVVDTVAPTSNIISGAGSYNSPAPSLEVTSSDDVSGVVHIGLSYQFKVAGGSFGLWKALPVSDYCSGIYADCWFYPSLPDGDGTYNFASIATDAAGNLEPGPSTAKATIVLDTIAPTSTAGPIAAGVKSQSLSIPYVAADTNGSGVRSVDLYSRYLAAGSSTWTDWGRVKTATASPISTSLTLGDGRYEFYTQATDNAGNAEPASDAADCWTVLDRTLPTVTVTPLPATTTVSSLPLSFTTSDGNGSGVASVALWQRVQLVGKSMGSWAQLSSAATSPYTVALAADGRYEFYLAPCDLAGNCRANPVSNTTANTFTVVATTPATVAGPLLPAVRTTALSVPFTVTSGTVSSVELWWRFEAAGSTTFAPDWAKSTSATCSVSSSTCSLTLSSGAGRYEFYTIGTSSGGSKEAAPSPLVYDAFTVLDTTAPISAATAVTSPRTVNSVAISFTASDPNGSGLAGVDLYQKYTTPGGTPPPSYTQILTGVTSPVTVTLSADGTYQFYTVARDIAGNVEAAPSTPDATTVLDTTSPTSSASALPAGVKSTTLPVPFTASDAGTSVTSVQLWQRFTAAGSAPSGAYSKVGTPMSGTSGTFSVMLSLGAGRYEFYTQATDTANNVEVAPNPPASADAFTVLDTTAPTSAAGPLTSPIGSTSLSVPYTSADVNGSGVTKVTLYQSYEAPGSTSWSTYAPVGTPGTTATGTIAITLGSGSGSYRFYTLATDAATNVEAVPTSPDATTVLDITAPTSTVTPLLATSSAASVTISYTSADNTGGSGLARTECWYRYKANDPATAGAWTSCGSNTLATGTLTLTFTPGTGIYDVLTVAVDNLGNREGGAANPPASTVAPKSSVRSVAWAAGAKVNTDTGSAVQDNASYAVGFDGTVYAVWEDSRNGNTDIYFSSRNPSTGVWAAETKLNADTGTAGQRTPSIAVDGSGNLYAVWADDRNGTTNTDIYFAKRTGTTWSANIKVNSDTGTAIQNAPRISVSSAGIAVAVWYDARSSQINIYSARLAAGSTTWSTNYNITTGYTTAVKAAPDVVVASDGTAWATWQDNRTGGGDIYTASLLPTATAWTTNTKVSDDSGTSSLDKSPRIGLTSANLPVVVYLDGRSTNAAVRVSNRTSGGTWNATVQVSDSLSKPASGLALAVKVDGGIIVAWDDTRVTATAIWGAQCEAGSGTSSVTRCGPTEKWSDQAGASSHPTIVASTTKVYLGWSDATAGNLDIRIRLRNPS